MDAAIDDDGGELWAWAPSRLSCAGGAAEAIDAGFANSAGIFLGDDAS
jgi:hypothetical protein